MAFSGKKYAVFYEKRRENRYSPEEKRAAQKVIEAGHKFGFGNMMALLRREWAETLMREYGFSASLAVQASKPGIYGLRPSHCKR